MAEVYDNDDPGAYANDPPSAPPSNEYSGIPQFDNATFSARADAPAQSCPDWADPPETPDLYVSGLPSTAGDAS